jgi:hypothetical protein
MTTLPLSFLHPLPLSPFIVTDVWDPHVIIIFNLRPGARQRGVRREGGLGHRGLPQRLRATHTVEGAMGATAIAGSLFFDDDLCADSDYQSYYYSNAHLNRLPPPHKHLNPCLPSPHLSRN